MATRIERARALGDSRRKMLQIESLADAKYIPHAYDDGDLILYCIVCAEKKCAPPHQVWLRMNRPVSS